MFKLFKKYGTYALAVLVLITALFYIKVNLPQNPTSAQLLINFEDGKSKKFEGVVPNGMTVLEALYSSSLGDSFELRYSIRDDGAVALAKIGDAVNFGNKTWHFYLNGKIIKTPEINKTRIRAGDFIEAKYE